MPSARSSATERALGRANRTGTAPWSWRRRPQDGASMTATTLEQLVAAKEIVVTCGSGGVGKTTTAAALGTMAAEATGGRVLVLTVDPARRLANATGGAVGGDARHEGELGRPRAAPRARRAHPRRHPRQPALQEHHREVRAEP